MNFFSLILFLISFLFLFFSRSDSVGLEDSGGFFLSACNFGISHPPGYPLFNLLGGFIHLSTKFFFSCLDSILILNILISSFCVCICYHIMTLFLNESNFRYKLIYFFISLFLLTSRSFSFLARSSEVYILHLFFVLLLTYILLIMKEDEKDYTNLFYLSFGLSLTNHWMLIILLIPYFYILIKYLEIEKKLFKPNLKPILYFFLGFSGYIYYFLNPFFSEYYFYYKVETLSDAARLFLRKDQMLMDVLPTWELKHSIYFATNFFERVISEFGIFVSVFGIFGSLFLFPIFCLSFSVPFILPFIWKTEVNQFTLEMFRYWELSSYVGILFGFGFFIQFLKSKTKDLGQKNSILSGIIFIFFIQIILSGKKQFNLKEDSLPKEYARIVLDSLPKNSILIVNKDTEAGIIGFENYGNKYREDISVYSQVSALFPKRIFSRKENPNIESQRIPILNFISKEIDSGKRIFTTRKLEQFNDKTVFPFKYSMYGVYFEISETERNPEIQKDILDRMKSSLFLENERREIEKNQNIFISEFYFPWRRYREFLTRDLCHSILIFEKEISKFQNLANCNFTYAQWIHVNNKNFELAEEEFRTNIPEMDYSYLSERIDQYKDLLLNRILYINSKNQDRTTKLVWIKNSILELKKIAVEFKSCENKLAKNLISLSNEISFLDDDLQNWKNNCK